MHEKRALVLPLDCNQTSRYCHTVAKDFATYDAQDLCLQMNFKSAACHSFCQVLKQPIQINLEEAHASMSSIERKDERNHTSSSA